jgi:hypothetical protein
MSSSQVESMQDKQDIQKLLSEAGKLLHLPLIEMHSGYLLLKLQIS